MGLKTRQQVSNWLNCHAHIPDKYLIAIMQKYPELNANWLIHNIGNLFNEQRQLRQINRNEFGFCDGCLEKEKEIKLLKLLLEKKESEIKEICKELGKAEERFTQLEKLMVTLKSQKGN